jgi:hypothetical protein
MSYNGSPDPLNQPVTTISIGASPFTWQNTSAYNVKVLINGGILTSVGISRDNVNYYFAGTGTYMELSPGWYVKVAYTLIPGTMVAIPTR